MGKFVEHLKRKAESAGCEEIELNAYKLKMSQYDPPTDAYRKKPLKERWHRWGNTGTLVQRDAMSAFLACHATEKRTRPSPSPGEVDDCGSTVERQRSVSS